MHVYSYLANRQSVDICLLKQAATRFSIPGALTFHSDSRTSNPPLTAFFARTLPLHRQSSFLPSHTICPRKRVSYNVDGTSQKRYAIAFGTQQAADLKGRIGNSANSSTRSTEKREQTPSSESLRTTPLARIVVVCSRM